jgi:methionyl aminopeptidase
MVNQEVRRELRSPREIRKMRKAGLLVWQGHQAANRILKPGITTAELDQAVHDVFRENDAEPLFLNYPGPTPFPAVTCISVNEELVHGIPGPRKIKEGDVVSIDTGCRIGGWCGDAAYTHAIGNISPQAKKLLKVTLDTLNLAIELMNTKKMWSEIAREMATLVNDAGMYVVEEMVGHGIGKNLHESPSVPNYCSGEYMANGDFDLRPGVVIAVEPMVQIGTKELECLADDWTQVAADRKYAAHFEHTIALTKDGPKRLTGPPTDEELAEMPEWLHDKSQWLVW